MASVGRGIDWLLIGRLSKLYFLSSWIYFRFIALLLILTALTLAPQTAQAGINVCLAEPPPTALGHH